MTYTNLNLPEATLKLLEEKGGIKCLADGIIAVENDSLEALRKVLKEAFPNAPTLKEELVSYKYFVALGFTFMACHSITLPSIPASVLVLELEDKPFEWGERVWASISSGMPSDFVEAIYLGESNNIHAPYIAVLLKSVGSLTVRYCQREKPKQPLRITPDMIRDKFNCEEFEIVES